MPVWRLAAALLTTAGLPPRCDASAKLPLKLEARMREARRVVESLNQPLASRLPVIAFTWAALYTGECASSGQQCPRITDPSDLHAEFELARSAGADGVIVWGANSDVEHGPDDCERFGHYLDEQLGPALRRLASAD